jgi:hypothetical protein
VGSGVGRIDCTVAALTFLSGDQIHIPIWADRFYLGRLFRCRTEPGRYVVLVGSQASRADASLPGSIAGGPRIRRIR